MRTTEMNNTSISSALPLGLCLLGCRYMLYTDLTSGWPCNLSQSLLQFFFFKYRIAFIPLLTLFRFSGSSFLFTFQAFWCCYDGCPPLGWFRIPVILSFSFLTLETEGLEPGTWAYRSLTLQDGLTSHLVTTLGPQLLLVVCFDSWWNLRPSMCSVLWGWKAARATFEVKAALGPITASCLGGSWGCSTLGALSVSW